MTTPFGFYSVRFQPVTTSWALNREDGNGTNWPLAAGSYLVQLSSDLPEQTQLHVNIGGVWREEAAVIPQGKERVPRTARMVLVNIPKGVAGLLRIGVHNAAGDKVNPSTSAINAKCGASLMINQIPDFGA